MTKAIQVTLEVHTTGHGSLMTASCMGERSITRYTSALPKKHPALALALLMCHRNKWHMDLVYGLLPNGDEVFCFRKNR